MNLDFGLDAIEALGAEEGEVLAPEAQEATYRRVRAQLEAGSFAEAVDDAFRLVHSNPWERAYHLALAYCLQHLEQHESAGRFYALAFMLDATDALCAYRMGECLGAMEQLPEAREAFEASVKLSWLDRGHAEVRREAELRLAELDALAA
ncbi:hypothetical protein [Ramlibacter rhizophilus]|uniref:Uncharacterized protein n=1 Tax=Ramlibacter rhizophilus TaxID=1781167 RepID=A0A4Z0BI63_9BURK|nr:hypothetical protein [Ramlibacter rhizophilus]TFY98099.1 hypothetical protein EZ242_16770 [Ramlibacter rhizophilus]